MKYLNKIASILCSAALGILVLTSCEGADLYTVGAPNWLSEKADSIAAAKAASQQEEVIEGLQEDVYDIGTADLKAGFWTLGKTYVLPAGQIWKAQFNLLVNPDNMYYKNFYVVLNAWNGTLGDEFGVIRFDNDPTKNSEWNTTGTEIDRSLVGGNFNNSSGDDSLDPSVQQMNGKITLTVDRTNGGLYIEMTNGTLTKTYTQKTSFPSTGSDADICCRIGVEGSLVSFLGSTIEPIGGFTSREDKQPEALILNGVPRKILQGTPAEEAFANVTATIQFEQGVSKNVNMADLTYQVVPNMSQLGKQTLIAAYAKTFKGEAANAPVIGTAEFEVVDKMYITIGASDNTSGWWSVHSDKIKVNPDETFVSTFTNYTSGVSNWNNFVICLTNADGSTEYGILRADNWGWGTGWAGEELASKCTPSGGQTDWATWLSAMDGAKVTVYVTNNGDGTCDVRSTMIGNDGNTYHQDYIGLNTVTNPDDFYFHYTVDNCHLEFNEVLGNEDNTTGWWVAHSTDIEVPAGMTYTTRFKNYTNGADNWNNFLVVLTREDNTEYTVLRADNYGWGDSYASCTPVMEDGRDWATWLSAMDGATVTVSVTNNGTTADVKCVMLGNDGVTYKQDYLGISPIEANNFRFRFTVEGGHLVFE